MRKRKPEKEKPLSKTHKKSLKNTGILVCFGPCASEIDPFRFILNKSSGQTGKLILGELLKNGAANVDILVFREIILEKEITRKVKKTCRYFNFGEFKKKLNRLLNTRKYGIIINLSALPDFRVAGKKRHKLDSRKRYRLDLVPNEKIIKTLRKRCKKAIIVGFKFDRKKGLIEKARKLLKANRLDFVVANNFSLENKHYLARILGKDSSSKNLSTKRQTAKILVKMLLNS